MVYDDEPLVPKKSMIDFSQMTFLPPIITLTRPINDYGVNVKLYLYYYNFNLILSFKKKK